MESRFADGSKDPANRFALRILRIERGTSTVVRTLGESYRGCFVHWNGERNEYCPGESDCPPRLHKPDNTIWKGYVAVEQWRQDLNRWLPTLLEITEGLELDFRGRFDRGQVWELSRAPQQKKKKATAVRGVLLETRDESTFPPAFDFRPHLVSVYHVNPVLLLHDNPMPPRMLLEPSEGAPPVKPGQLREPVRLPVGKTFAQIREEQEARRLNGNGTPPG